MERIKDLLRQSEFHLIFFFMCIVLFSWPLVSFSSIERLASMFIYLFVSWTLVILLQLLVSRAIRPGSERIRTDGDH
jgi:hypothetical protein